MNLGQFLSRPQKRSPLTCLILLVSMTLKTTTRFRPRNSDLGRRTQRKKKREEKRSDPRNKSGSAIIAIDHDDDGDPQINAVLTELSAMRSDIHRSDFFLRRAEINMQLIEKMSLTNEQKQAQSTSISHRLSLPSAVRN